MAPGVFPSASSLQIGTDTSCPANSTIFDVGHLHPFGNFDLPSPDRPHPELRHQRRALQHHTDLQCPWSRSRRTPRRLHGKQLAAGGDSWLGCDDHSDCNRRLRSDSYWTGRPSPWMVPASLTPLELNAASTASFTTSTLALGTHNITAVLTPGALDFYPAADSQVFKQQIVPPPTVVTPSPLA